MCRFVLKIWKLGKLSVLKQYSSIQQRFWDLSTQRIHIVLKKSFESRKVLFEVKKLSFLLHGHNSYNVWEWKTVNCKGIFVNWRSSRIFFFLSFFFFNKYYLAFLLQFILSFKRCISIEMEQKKTVLRILNPLEESRPELTCWSESQTLCYVYTAMPTSTDTMMAH